ncbi:MAG TPA: DUF4145 domain-containing protein [Dissulfurispiraceae bacterium]|nr:DUF4145 domain-containing protein [Dissulfurispiraceae bacterium]
MQLPNHIEQKILARFDELIAIGASLEHNTTTVPGRRFSSWANPDQFRKEPDKHFVEWSGFVQWRSNCVSLLAQILPAEHVQNKAIDSFGKLNNSLRQLKWGIATLKAIKDDFEKGFLGNLLLQVESALSSDYMGQAEQLLKEGKSGNHDHVPAAVLSGAVLEKALRTLCGLQKPRVETIIHNGKAKTLNPLVDDLKKAGAFKETKAKQLRAWAEIRNHAAHGNFDQFTRKDVEQMILGIKSFLSEHMK